MKKKTNQKTHTLIQSFVTKLYTITDPTFFALITKIPCLHLRETTFKLTEQKTPKQIKIKQKKKVRTTFCHKMVQNLIKNKNEGKGY